MRAYRDFLPGAPEELGVFLGLKTAPKRGAVPGGGSSRRSRSARPLRATCRSFRTVDTDARRGRGAQGCWHDVFVGAATVTINLRGEVGGEL
jgi:hypothetical protein